MAANGTEPASRGRPSPPTQTSQRLPHGSRQRVNVRLGLGLRDADQPAALQRPIEAAEIEEQPAASNVVRLPEERKPSG